MNINNTQYTCVGLFGCYSSGLIKNVHIKDAVIISSVENASVGGIVGSSMNKLENCTVEAIIQVSNAGNVGGVVGSSGAINNCIFYGSVSGSASNIGGIVGQSGSNIENCINHGLVENTRASNNSLTSGAAGGIAGWQMAARIKNCISYGTIKSTNLAGAIAGFGNLDIENCIGLGMIYASNATICGSIAGYAMCITAIVNCSFKGSSNLAIGTFVADATTVAKTAISGCYSQIGSRKAYSNGDFSGFTVVPNMNNDLPMQNELFAIAIGGQTSDYVIDHLKSKGFSLIA